MELTEIRRKIEDLTKEKEKMEKYLRDEMVAVILETSKENYHGIKKVSAHLSVINSSQVFGRSWSLEFFNWEESANTILKYLSNTPVMNWKQKLEDLLKAEGDVIKLKRRGTIWPGVTAIVQRTPIDRVFIEKIVERI